MNRRYFIKTFSGLLAAACVAVATVPFPLGFFKQATATATVTPSNIANLDHWYKADSFSLSDGTKVGGSGKEWVDSIGGSTYYGRSIGSAFDPTYKTGVANGLPGVLFTNLTSLSTQNLLDCSNGSAANKVTYAGDYTIVCVIKPTTITGGFNGGSIMGDAYARGGIVDQSGTTMKADNGTAAISVTGLSPNDMDTVLSVTYECSSGTTTFYRNNSSVGSGSLTGMRTSHMGASANIDGNTSISVRFNGYIFEVLYYGRALTSTERGQLQTYFSRWGL